MYIKTDVFDSAINKYFNELDTDTKFSGHTINKKPVFFKTNKNSSWYLVVLFSKEIILVKMRYKTLNKELWA